MTSSVLRVADADGKRALNWAIEHHNDPKVIKLVVSRYPPALGSVVGGEGIVWYFRDLPAENRFSNYDEVFNLLLDCYVPYKQHRFPRLIELCGTSDALAALVAAHSEDDLSLEVLCLRHSWNKVLARIKKLPTQAAISELFSQDESGATTFARAADEAASAEVLESLFDLAKLDAEKRSILDIADFDLRLPLRYIAKRHPDPAAVKLVVRHHHPVLLTENNNHELPLDYADCHNKNPATVSLVRKLTVAYKHGHFSALVRFCGTSPTLQALALRSTDDLPLLMLCLCGSWEVAAARIEKIPTQDAVEEIHVKDGPQRQLPRPHQALRLHPRPPGSTR